MTDPRNELSLEIKSKASGLVAHLLSMAVSFQFLRGIWSHLCGGCLCVATLGGSAGDYFCMFLLHIDDLILLTQHCVCYEGKINMKCNEKS